VAIVPVEVADRHIGQRVVVVGAFSFREGLGREIAIEHIGRLAPDRPDR
jgi:hypothetical protein